MGIATSSKSIPVSVEIDNLDNSNPVTFEENTSG
jgi:hypothetical protein